MFFCTNIFAFNQTFVTVLVKFLLESIDSKHTVFNCVKSNYAHFIRNYFSLVRSLHLHFPDIASDYNVKADDVNICVQTALCSCDSNDLYQIPSFQLFRNDFISHGMRNLYGTAVYVQENVQLLTEPLRCNYNDVEMTFINVNQPVPNLHIVQISRSKGENLKKFALQFSR